MTMETTTKLADLITITNRLIDLMGKEIEMLRSMRPQDIGALQKDKVSLALAYERHMQELRDDPSLLTAERSRTCRPTERSAAAKARRSSARCSPRNTGK